MMNNNEQGNVKMRYEGLGDIAEQRIAEEKEVNGVLEDLEEVVVSQSGGKNNKMENKTEMESSKTDKEIDLNKVKAVGTISVKTNNEPKHVGCCCGGMCEKDKHEEKPDVILNINDDDCYLDIEPNAEDESIITLDDDYIPADELDELVKYTQDDAELTRNIYKAYGVNVDLEPSDKDVIEFSVNGKEFIFHDDVNITVIHAPVFGCDILVNLGLGLTSRNLTVTLDTNNVSEIVVEGLFSEDDEITVGDLVDHGLAYIVDDASSTIYVEDGHVVRSFLDIADEESIDSLLF